MSDVSHVVCAHCLATNRVPAARLGADPRCGKCQEPLFEGYPAELTDASFERTISRSDLPVVVDFWAEWCGPCKMIAPILDEIAEEYGDRIKVAKMDIDSNPATPRQFNIRGIPTLMIFRDGKVQSMKVGALTKGQLKTFVEEAV